ncbi:MAG: Hsp70 family protein [Lachnospiraceae bacterium]|nr:Hsp70 family protein [Lachnospiraceae bacterium]
MGRIVGIDLGTTTSEIAYIKNGKPEIIKNGYSSITPSVVGLDKNLEILVGQPAKNQLVSAKERTVAEVKRKMGTSDAVIMSGKKFTPVEISTFILKELKKIGEEFLQEEISGAVITVPANFNDAQRQATKEAGERAGLVVERIINEPTAAALAFGIDNMETEGKILVYDLGGGTFDVTVLEMIEGSLDVMASRGVNLLGGKDFDEAIVSEIVQNFMTEYQMDLSKDLKAMARVKDEAEKAKITLSSANSVIVNLPFIAFKDGEAISFEMELTRSRYEELIADYIKKSMDTVNEALTAAKISAGDVDIVLAVGGSSRTPLVMQSLKNVFGNKLRGGINPDEAVALGAAVQAGILSNEIAGAGSIAIFDVCNHSLGVACLNERNNNLEFSRLIMRDTHLPFAMTRRYYTVHDFQRELEVEVYQGENDDLSMNTRLGSFEVTDVPENYAGNEAIDIEFKYNINGILEVNVKVISTGKVTSKEFNMYNYDAPKSKAEAKMEELEWENYSLASEIKTTVMLYQNRRNGLPEEAKQKADALMRELKQAVAENDAKKVEEIDDNLTALLFEF